MLTPFRRAALFVLFALLCVRAHGADEEIVFVAYNLENYLTMERREPGEPRGVLPKPEKEKAGIIKVISEIKPDILGVCEMGTPADLKDLQARLRDAGISLPHTEWVQAADPDRHLALLSRFPITTRQSVTDARFKLNGREEQVKRGFLDVTVKINPEYELRMIGVHLKSKRAAEEGEALLRRNEAHLLRQRIDKVLEEKPDVNLLVYGDCNDTKNEPAIQEIIGVRGKPNYMADLWLKDHLGDRWTHYWRYADLYSRIDYVFVSPALWREVALDKSRVYRSETWSDGSDHRALVTTIRTTNVK